MNMKENVLNLEQSDKNHISIPCNYTLQAPHKRDLHFRWSHFVSKFLSVAWLTASSAHMVDTSLWVWRLRALNFLNPRRMLQTDYLSASMCMRSMSSTLISFFCKRDCGVGGYDGRIKVFFCSKGYFIKVAWRCTVSSLTKCLQFTSIFENTLI